jgi:hypothetical protein
MKRPPKSHSLESQLIIMSCQTVISAREIEELSVILKSPIDWTYAIGVLRRNAVLPLFSWNMLNHFAEELPNNVKQFFEQNLKEHIRSNIFLTGKLLEITQFFNANNIEALPFKGPMLAIQAYGNPALRKYGDLDVLVQPRHFRQAVQLLKDNGYSPVTSVSWLKKTNWYVSRKKDIYFVNKNRSVNLELHWKLSGSHFGLPKEMNRLWDRLEFVHLAGTAVSALPFNDLLIYLCLHGSRHSWERLSWVCDVNELIRSKQDVDWDGFFTAAKRVGCENVVALGLRLIHEFFGFNAPGLVWDQIKSDPMYDAMVAEIRDRLFSHDAKPVKIGERYLYHLKLKERPFDRWKLHFHYISWYMRIILTPNEMDRSILHFPRLLYPLYYLTRPFRLVFTYLSGKSATH